MQLSKLIPLPLNREPLGQVTVAVPVVELLDSVSIFPSGPVTEMSFPLLLVA